MHTLAVCADAGATVVFVGLHAHLIPLAYFKEALLHVHQALPHEGLASTCHA